VEGKMDSLKYQEIQEKTSVRKLKHGPSNRTMIPSTPQIPPKLGCRRSPRRFYSDHHSHHSITARKPNNITELEAIAHGLRFHGKAARSYLVFFILLTLLVFVGALPLIK